MATENELKLQEILQIINEHENCGYRWWLPSVIEVDKDGYVYYEDYEINDCVQLMLVKENSSYIQYLDGSCEVAQIASVIDDVDNIQYIKYPCVNAQIVAVLGDEKNIKYCDFDEKDYRVKEMFKHAIEHNPLVVLEHHADFLTQDLLELAISTYPLSITYVRHPSEYLKRLAISLDLGAIEVINEIDDELWAYIEELEANAK